MLSYSKGKLVKKSLKVTFPEEDCLYFQGPMPQGGGRSRSNTTVVGRRCPTGGCRDSLTQNGVRLPKGGAAKPQRARVLGRGGRGLSVKSVTSQMAGKIPGDGAAPSQLAGRRDLDLRQGTRKKDTAASAEKPPTHCDGGEGKVPEGLWGGCSRQWKSASRSHK